MGGKSRILVVEDNSDVRRLMALVLGRSGYEVVEAATGIEALDQTRAMHPDLIIMDLSIPKMTGDEVTARIKADPATQNIPIVVNTAYHKGVFVERAIAAGAVEILYKPTELKVFLDTIRRHLCASQNQPNVQDTSPPARENAPSPHYSETTIRNAH
jgi:two-component system cell cycle response regulator DivK